MNDIKKLAQGIIPEAVPQILTEVQEPTGNLYKSIAIIAKRANQISAALKEELHAKLEEFATSTDTLEEVSENREQIEISRFYERLPNPAILAKEEFLRGETYWRDPNEESEDELSSE